MGAAPLLEIDNLSTHYVSAKGTRVIRAVEGVSLSLGARETLRHCRRVGFRQEHAGAEPGAAAAAVGADRQWQDVV